MRRTLRRRAVAREPRSVPAGVRRRVLVAAAPVLVPGSMSALFTLLRRRTTPARAYNAGFAAYWIGWCVAFPVSILGPRRSLAMLRAGRRPTLGEAVLLVFPVVGAVATTLAPNLRRIDLPVATVMVGSAAMNAVGEELLWRGLFVEEFGDSVVFGSLWPWLGFTAWHLAPQLIFPSLQGRWRFTAGAGAVGAASAATAWRTRGLRAALLPHFLTDACGVAAAEFRLGRPQPPPRRGPGDRRPWNA